MELHIVPIVTFLCVALVGSHAAITPELYWKEALPNTAMPKSVRNSLPSDQEWMDNKGTSVDVHKGGVVVNNKKPGGGGTDVNVGPKGGVGVSTGKPGGGHTDVNVGPKGGVRVNTGKPHKGGADVGVGKGVIVHAGPKKKPVYVGVHPGYNPFNYNYKASATQLHDDPTRALFFLEKDMQVGQQMSMHFTQSTNAATFLPREEAQPLPFSSDKMSEILHEFSVQPGSEEAQTIEQTIKGCESKGVQGEQKYCATSLESMVDYAKSTLGNNVRAVSTEGRGGYNNRKGQEYTITAVKKVATTNSGTAVCHKQNYAYAVFYCHKAKGTSPYVVSLISEDGLKSRAVAVCHKDTSAWNPKHLAFQVLKVALITLGSHAAVVERNRKLSGGHADVKVNHRDGVHVDAGKRNKGGAKVDVNKGGVTVNAGTKEKPVYVGVKPGLNPFQYDYASSKKQAQGHPARSLFFLEKDMKTGHQMNMNFTQSTNGAIFLPREQAQSIPFSTDKMPEILREFSVQPGSEEAQIIEQTIKGCETKGVPGEQKYCATCLEDMVDYAKSTLGKNARPISTEVESNKGQKYTFSKIRKVARDDGALVCHKQNYAYAVFYCHKMKGTSPYVVSLINEDGSKAKPVAICHKDTSNWNPKHLAFQILNVKPGSAPICHFLPEDHIVWVNNAGATP